MNLVPRDRFFGLDKFFDDFWAPVGGETGATDTFFAPRVDIVAKDHHYEIKAELPGVKKDDIHITLDDGMLTIDAETREETSEEEKGKFIRRERRYGRYSRSFNLGGNVQESDISASFEDGVLTLVAPKVKQLTSQQRQIEIR